MSPRARRMLRLDGAAALVLGAVLAVLAGGETALVVAGTLVALLGADALVLAALPDRVLRRLPGVRRLA